MMPFAGAGAVQFNWIDVADCATAATLLGAAGATRTNRIEIFVFLKRFQYLSFTLHTLQNA